MFSVGSRSDSDSITAKLACAIDAVAIDLATRTPLMKWRSARGSNMVVSRSVTVAHHVLVHAIDQPQQAGVVVLRESTR